MNKKELIAAVAEKADVTKKDAEAVVKATLETITAAIADGEKVQLIGFGTFDVRTRAARTGRTSSGIFLFAAAAGRQSASQCRTNSACSELSSSSRMRTTWASFSRP